MKLMVIDGNSIVNRAFYGIRTLSTKDGTPTNAVYGFLNILQKLLNDEQPEALCVAFDLRAPTFRHEKFEAYKAQRKGMPDELAVQIPILKDVLDAMNINRLELTGYEADDLIGTVAKKSEEYGWECVVVTGDKDSFQLITDKTHVYHVKSRMGQTETKQYDVPAFMEEYGFEPPKMVDLKALMGDASDNIPGVAGVGEKTAMDLIRRFGTVNSIYENLGTLDIKDTVKNKLVSGRDSADMSYDLATICRDAPIEFDPEDNIRRPPDNDRLYELFRALEFSKLTEKFGLTPPPAAKPEQKYKAAECTSVSIKTENDFVSMVESLKSVPCVSVFFSDDISALAAVNGETAYLLCADNFAGDWKKTLDTFFSGVKKAGHNVKEIQRKLILMGVYADGWVFDSAIAAYLLDPVSSSYELERLTEIYGGFTLKKCEENDGQLSLMQETETAFDLIPKAAAVSFLMETFMPKLRDFGMEKLFSEVEMPLCLTLAKMECEGVLVDKKALVDFGNSLLQGMEKIEQSIYGLAGERFNINSPKQLGVILFEKLMLPAPKKTKTGWSTSADVLEKLRPKHEIIQQILDYRELSKLKSTYADGLVKVIAPDGRIHTTFQMTVTATGRLSSTEPNLQNIPVRRELGGEIRKMFVAGDGNVFVDADYSQIELRLLAHISNDETMKKAFLDGEDIHRVTASQVFDTPFDEVTGLQRSRAKAVNFGIVYGISQFSLSQDIGVSIQEAKRYIDNYLAKYHGVREYMKSVVERAKLDGWVSTLYGRRRWLPELKSSNFNVRSFGERVALNMPIQGTAADIMKIAMNNVSRRLETEKLRARLILQIHDELIVECPESEEARVKNILREEMENAATLSVPLTADAAAGKSWYNAK
ncbi:MAG: DNA polymerase I [Oscillospiraceae bacterium]